MADLVRLEEFLAPLDARAAAEVVRSITAGAAKLVEYPRLGERLEQYQPREVRKLIVGTYELRYEVRGDAIFVLRLWHTREKR
jgi:plasmid stabilization system protein ParE